MPYVTTAGGDGFVTFLAGSVVRRIRFLLLLLYIFYCNHIYGPVYV